jgi:hypothetical protein
MAFVRGSHDGAASLSPTGKRQVSRMGYRLAPIEVNIAGGCFAEFRIYNDQGEPIATFGFADEHEARVARDHD